MPPFNASRLVFAVVTVISTVTILDAIPFSLAATPMVKLTHGNDHAHWNRMFRTACLVPIPLSVLLIEGPSSVLQTASIIIGLPVLIVLCLGVVALFPKCHCTGRRGKPSHSRPQPKNKEATHESHRR